ncbi:MAG: undecaprenyldiphospho-muramoylpentapeptide beta-N-acetylglucosaminyltransferase [Firmicutes bacterium]|nr:undecaprenyldiphospho-muramoylpentapeptide beta-N-acetylglucosaminyltransferase [Bacillota bacterium]
MKVIMTGGGTGGHIYPAIAIADTIRREHPDAEILFVGTQRGMEKDLVPKNGYPIRFITVSGFHRKQIWKNVGTARDLMKGLREAKKILKDFRPDVVIGTGGYVCGPVVRTAHKLGIPCYVHEQNAFPGMTNKMLEQHVEKVFLSFEEAGKYFKQPEKHVVVGNPIRSSFFMGDSEHYREKLGIAEGEFAVLCFGGSLGAEKINNVMMDAIHTFNGVKGLKLFFGTGKRYYDDICKALESSGITLEDNIKVMPYIDHMNEYLNACDVVISRAGALTISEITACGKASILIPSPNVTGNHQYHNAKVVADRGGAILIEEKDLTSDEVMKAILYLKNDPTALKKMSLASAEAGCTDSADRIYQHLNIQ